MLVFWGDIKALTGRKAADCKFPLRYSIKAVSNSNRIVTEYSNIAVTKKLLQQPIKERQNYLKLKH